METETPTIRASITSSQILNDLLEKKYARTVKMHFEIGPMVWDPPIFSGWRHFEVTSALNSSFGGRVETWLPRLDEKTGDYWRQASVDYEILADRPKDILDDQAAWDCVCQIEHCSSVFDVAAFHAANIRHAWTVALEEAAIEKDADGAAQLVEWLGDPIVDEARRSCRYTQRKAGLDAEVTAEATLKAVVFELSKESLEVLINDGFSLRAICVATAKMHKYIERRAVPGRYHPSGHRFVSKDDVRDYLSHSDDGTQTC